MHNFKQKSVVKKLISIVLVLLLASSTLLESAAAMASEVLVPIPLDTARLNEVPDGNYLYFGTASANVEEDDAAYSVVIYREGDLSEEATVDIHTIDLSATYGKDYVLMMSDTEKVGDGQTILEKYLGDLDSYENDLNVQDGDYYIIGDEEIVDEQSAEVEGYVEVEGVSDNADTTDTTANKKSSLALWKEEQTGEETRELYKTEYNDFLDAAIQQLIPQTIDDMGYSSNTTITFAPGEAEKTVVFRIKDDNKSEGTETFSLKLANAVGAEIYQVANVSVAIIDDEETVHSKVSFGKSHYNAKNGTVTVTIKRTDADYSLVDMQLLSSEGTAKAGENYEEINEIVSFAPYEMEKNITIPVCGEGSFSLLLTELTACEEGKYTKTTIDIISSEEHGLETYNTMLTETAEGTSSFDITVNGRNYTVEYTQGEATGKILDYKYDPAVEVGVYYFALSTDKGGIFQYGEDKYSYGDKPGSCGTLDSVYVYQDDYGKDLAQHDAYGDIAYYNPVVWEKGLVWATAQYNSIPGVFFQLVAPDWEGTKSTYGGQQFHISSSSLGLPAAKIYEGDFDRTADNAALVLKNIESRQYNRKFHVSINAEDEESSKTPKSYLRFYGVACMYKKYEISVEEPTAMTFQTSTGGTVSEVPVQASIQCGATTGNVNTRYIFANTDGTNIEFDLGYTSINGLTEKFGTLTGYTITIGSGDDRVTKNYPDDFITFLDTATSNSDSYVKYDADSIEKEKNKVNYDFATVPCDGYFIDWIDSIQKSVSSDGSKGYLQKLSFKPKFEYINVDVTVLEPAENEGIFTTEGLSAGGTYTYHAGDKLNLTTAASKAGYTAVGYEVSTNKGVDWNSVTDKDYLTLNPRDYVDGYYIRPLIVENSNCIEITGDGDIADKILGVNYQGLIKDETLQEKNLNGRYILCLTDADDTLDKQMTPQVGEIYAINFKAYTDGDDTYYPVITDAYGNKYNGQTLYYQARQNAVDNVLTLSYEKVTDVQKYTLSGKLMSNYLPIISTGTATKHLGIKSYVVSLAAGKVNTDASNIAIETVTDTSDLNGDFTLDGIYGKSGDKLTMLIGNGMDTQIKTVTLGSSTSMDLGNIYLSYPYDAPYIASLNYSYDKAANNTKTDNISNSVQIYDDTINITAVISSMEYDITKIRFTVYTLDAVNNIDENTTSEYIAYADETNPGVFKISIPKMTENLHNGDRIRAALGTTLTEDGYTYDYWYPDVETGYVFETTNSLIVPQSYSTTTTPASVNVPIIGSSNASSSSGLLTFSRTNWDNNTGYTLSINVDALCYGSSSPSTAEKIEKYDQLHASAQTAHESKAAAKDASERVSDLTQYAGYMFTELQEYVDDDLFEELDTVDGQLKAAQGQLDQINTTGKQAKNAIAKYSDAVTAKVDVLFLLAFDFVYDASKDEYIFCCGSVSAGGSVSVANSQYFVIYGVPFYLNISGFMQGDLTVYYPGGDSTTAAYFESYSGNIADMMTETSATMSLTLQLKGAFGTGMCNVAGAGGAATFQLQYSVPITDSDNYGVLLKGDGALYLDVLIGRIELSLVTAYLGFGTYEGKTSLDFFGGAVHFQSTGADDNVSSSSDEANLELAFRDYNLGTSDMSSFGKSAMIQSTPTAVNYKVLLDDAGDTASPKIVKLDDGRIMILFIGNRDTTDDQFNSRTLYYAVYQDGYWYDPEPVDNTLERLLTFDAQPTIIQTEDKLIAAWVDSSDINVNDESTIKEKLNALDISISICDINDYLSWKVPDTLTDQGFSNIYTNTTYFDSMPQLNVIGDTLYCNYIKRDVSEVSKVEDVLDLTNMYSTDAYIMYDLNERLVIDNANGTRESVIYIKHDNIQDPLVTDYHCITTAIDGVNYMVAAYTVDEDIDLTTSEDRELYLNITNLSTNKAYYPIRLTNDGVNQASPELTNLNGETYLTWVESGYLFNMMNVTDLLEAFFHNDEITVSAYRDSAEDDNDWYQKTASEIGLSVEDDDEYDKTFYGLAKQGIFKAAQANFNSHENVTTSISDYKVVTNGKDIYIFYTDFGSDDPEDLSMELYGVRYHAQEGQSTQSSSADGSQEENKTEAGFGQAVRITNFGGVIDDFDLVMDKDSNISLVSNFYTQSINESTGELERGRNRLIEIDFELKGSVSIVDNNIDLPKYLVKGSQGYISFEIVNDGMLPTNSFEITASTVKNGTETNFYNETFNMELNSGETYAVEIPWTIPDDLSNTDVKVTVNELNVGISNPSTVSVTAPYNSVLIMNKSTAKWDGSGCTLNATVTNIGNKKADAYTMQACINDGTKVSKIYATQELPALDSGESVEVSIPFTPDVEDFSDLGVINMMMRAMDGDEQVSCVYTKLVPGLPIVAKINGGEGTLKLTSGSSSKLDVTAAPWGDLVGKARFVSSDPTIASVDSNGNVSADASGSAIITAYYDSGATKSIVVNVTGSSSGSDSGSVSGSDGNFDDSANNIGSIPPKTPTTNPTDESQDTTFSDVNADAYYAEAVNWAVKEKITAGIGNRKFAPDMACTRAQIVSFMWRAAGAPEPTTTVNPFTDVSEDDYYFKAMLWAVENGITVGTSATTFSPNATCTRAQAVNFIYRYEKSQGGGFTGAWMIHLPFTDVSEADYEAVAWCYMNKITGGISDTSFAPNADCTRGQIVSFLYRYHNCKTDSEN